MAWENKTTLFLADVVLSMRQVRLQKLPPAEASAPVPPAPGRERRWRAGGRNERKEKAEKNRIVVNELKLKNVEASKGDVIE